ncbi:MAG: hypothetical protein O2954_15615, partial [bacterium]|nr:hypothetical protein [bacterium]
MKISSATPYVSGLFFARVLGRAFLWVFCFTVPVSAYVLQMDRNSRGQIVSIRWGSNEVRNGISFWVDANSFPFSKTQTQQAINASIS